MRVGRMAQFNVLAMNVAIPAWTVASILIRTFFASFSEGLRWRLEELPFPQTFQCSAMTFNVFAINASIFLQFVCTHRGRPVSWETLDLSRSEQLVQTAPQAQREEVGRLRAQSSKVHVVGDFCLGAMERSSGVERGGPGTTSRSNGPVTTQNLRRFLGQLRGSRNISATFSQVTGHAASRAWLIGYVSVAAATAVAYHQQRTSDLEKTYTRGNLKRW